MKKTCLLIFVALMSLSPALFAQQDARENNNDLDAEEVARRVQAFYKETQDFQAHFRQTYTDVAAGDSKVSQGQVFFKKPGKMRWDYLHPEDRTRRDKLYVSDGSAFYIYEYEFQQVFKQCLADSQLPTSLRFLMGEGELLEEFDVEFARGSTRDAPVLRLVPKQPTPQYKELRFTVHPQDFQVTKTVLYDPYGNTNAIEFRQMMVNRNLPDSGFEFRPPQGARLINPQKSCP